MALGVDSVALHHKEVYVWETLCFVNDFLWYTYRNIYYMDLWFRNIYIPHILSEKCKSLRFLLATWWYTVYEDRILTCAPNRNERVSLWAGRLSMFSGPVQQDHYHCQYWYHYFWVMLGKKL